MSSVPRSRTIARLRPVTGMHAVIAAVLLAAPSTSWAGDTWLSCTVKRHVPILDSEKFDRALAAGEWDPTMSEADAQKAIAKLSAATVRCILNPGDKVQLLNNAVVRDPIWIAIGEDESCVGVVLGKSALECEPPSDRPSW